MLRAHETPPGGWEPSIAWILTAITGLLEFCSRETGAARAAAHHLISTLAVVGSERVQQLALQSGVVESTLASAASWDEKEAAMTHVSYSHRSLDPGLREKWLDTWWIVWSLCKTTTKLRCGG